jgi:hypothetical protein
MKAGCQSDEKEIEIEELTWYVKHPENWKPFPFHPLLVYLDDCRSNEVVKPAVTSYQSC